MENSFFKEFDTIDAFSGTIGRDNANYLSLTVKQQSSIMANTQNFTKDPASLLGLGVFAQQSKSSHHPGGPQTAKNADTIDISQQFGKTMSTNKWRSTRANRLMQAK